MSVRLAHQYAIASTVINVVISALVPHKLKVREPRDAVGAHETISRLDVSQYDTARVRVGDFDARHLANTA